MCSDSMPHKKLKSSSVGFDGECCRERLRQLAQLFFQMLKINDGPLLRHTAVS